MTYEPLAFGHLAVELTRQHAGSARPDAPVVRTTPRPARVAGTRLRLAGSLRTLARWVEPSVRPSNLCQPS